MVAVPAGRGRRGGRGVPGQGRHGAGGDERRVRRRAVRTAAERRAAAGHRGQGARHAGGRAELRSAWSTPTPPSGSTRRSRRWCPAAAGSASSASPARSASRSWPTPPARGLGLSTFVSAGNRADLSGNDLLQYWQTDPATDVVLLYLESFGNPRKFARLARRLARTKPVVAVKSRPVTRRRRRRAGAGAVRVAVPTRRGCRRCSSRLRGDQGGDPDQLFDMAQLLANQPLPAGRRVAVVGNSTALGMLVADACMADGLELAPATPVDLGVPVDAGGVRRAVRGRWPAASVDALVAVFVPPVATPGAEYAAALRRGGRRAAASRWWRRSSAGRACPPSSRFRTRRPGAGPRLGAVVPDAGAGGAALAGRCGTREWRRRPVGAPSAGRRRRRTGARAGRAAGWARATGPAS